MSREDFPNGPRLTAVLGNKPAGLTSDPGERDCKEHELEPKAFFCSHSAQRVVNGKSEDQQKGDTGSGHDTESVEHGIDGVRNRVIGSLLDLSFRDFIGVGLILLSQQAETEIFLVFFERGSSLSIVRILTKLFQSLDSDHTLSDTFFVFRNDLVQTGNLLIQGAGRQDAGEPGNSDFEGILLQFGVGKHRPAER